MALRNNCKLAERKVSDETLRFLVQARKVYANVAA